MRREDPEPVSEPDSLDELLGEADWPEPSAWQLARLQRQWERVRPTATTARRWRVAAAAAAAVLILGTAWAVWNGSGGAPVAGPDNEQPPKPAPIPPVNLSHEREYFADSQRQDHRSPAALPGRSPTAYEQIVLQATARRRRIAAADRPEVDPVESALADLVGDPHADAKALAQPLLERRAASEKTLMHRVRHSRGDERRAALRLLVHVLGPEVVPILAPLTRDEETRDIAVAALCRLAEPPMLVRLAKGEPDPKRQRQYLDALLGHDDKESFSAFLPLILDPRTGDVAAKAAAAMSDPPLDALIRFLDDAAADPSRATAAAVMLGCVDDPRAISALIDRAGQAGVGEAALAGLLASRHEEAVRFLRLAQRDPRLAAALKPAVTRLRVEIQLAAARSMTPFDLEVH